MQTKIKLQLLFFTAVSADYSQNGRGIGRRIIKTTYLNYISTLFYFSTLNFFSQ